MKARIAKEAERVLYYAAGNMPKERQLYELVDSLGIQFVRVTDEDLNYTLGYCAGVNGLTDTVRESGSMEKKEELMLFSGLSHEKLDQLLRAMREAEIEKVELKAMLTPTNRTWTWIELYKELCRERAAMG